MPVKFADPAEPANTGRRKESVFAIEPATRRPSFYSVGQEHLTGLKGILVIQSFIWLFFHVFIPAVTPTGPIPTQSGPSGGRLTHDFGYILPGTKRDLAAPGLATDPPTYQVIIRKVLSPLLFEESLIYSFFILLSARTICIHYLQTDTAHAYARSLIARPIRIGIPLCLALAFSIAIFSTIDTSYMREAARAIPNDYLRIPEQPQGATAAFNSMFNLLFITKDYSLQMGNLAWPSRTLWAVSAIYVQSYTVYILMVIMPHSRPSWHIKGLFIFAFGSWWFNSWGWYSATGLFLADLSINPALRAALMRGIQFERRDISLPYWFFAVLFFIVGAALKYIWIAALPHLELSGETYMHPAKYVGQEGNFGFLDPSLPYPRMDNWFVIVGVLLGLEFSEVGKKFLTSKPLMVLGRRALSIFVAQCLIMYTVGLILFNHLRINNQVNSASAKAGVFFTVLPVTAIAAEVFYRTLDRPAQWAGHAFFKWTRE